MHNHAHTHDHHSHKTTNYNKVFFIGISLNIAYVAIEAVYGLLIDSLALLADAGHNLSDVLGLLLAWGASYLVQKAPTKKHTYGFKKSSILAAFLNALILMVAIGAIIWEAIGRFSHPQAIEGSTIIIVAGIGTVINLATALLFLKDRERDINIKGAFLHMAADAAISLGVVIVGIVLTYTRLYWLDPLVSIVIAIIIFFGTWSLLKESTNLALDAIPENVNREEVEKYLKSLDGVEEVHDLHIWAMSTTETAMTAHLVKPDYSVDDNFTTNVADELKHHFNIHHTTLQIENGECDKDCASGC